MFLLVLGGAGGADFAVDFVAGFAAGFDAGFAAGVLLPTSTAILLKPVPYSVASRTATLKQIPVPLTPRQIPRAALTPCLVHPRPVKFFLDQLDERSLLPTTVTLSLSGDGETTCQRCHSHSAPRCT
jgi:hypothetical protein